MVSIKELLEYNEEVRYRYFEALNKLPWEELVKNREASFHSLRNIFIHTLNAINYWLGFLMKEQLHTSRKYEEYKNMEEIRSYMEKTEARLNKYIDSLSPNGLAAKYMRKNSVGETIEVSVEDILIHLFEEEVHHRGELIALLWQISVTPPNMSWKFL